MESRAHGVSVFSTWPFGSLLCTWLPPEVVFNNACVIGGTGDMFVVESLIYSFLKIQKCTLNIKGPSF